MTEVQQLPLARLIDRFNEPCGLPDCRFTSQRVNDRWCPQHRLLRREIERRQRPRECDDCHACCIHLPLADRPAHTPCPELKDGRCGVYEKRPGACRRFRCAWLQGFSFSTVRPDRCGVLVQPVVEDGGVRLNVIECDAGALDRNPLIITACQHLDCTLVRACYLDGRVIAYRRA